jgi:hypothetical protein
VAKCIIKWFYFRQYCVRQLCKLLSAFVKPIGLLIDSRTKGRCQIANCGLAVHAPKSNSRRKNVCSVPFFERGNHPGTPLSYQAPEIIEGKPYDETVKLLAPLPL